MSKKCKITEKEARNYINTAFDKKEWGKDMTKTLNDIRKAQIKNIDYRLLLRIMKGKTYNGSVKISFERTSGFLSTDVVFDFKGEVTSCNLFDTEGNFVPIDYRRSGVFHALSASSFTAGGKYVLEVSFKKEYENDGTGLHSYIDPTDNAQYLYSQAETFYCNYIFPTFDQPNLKATLLLTVIHPTDWRVITNEIIKKTFKLRDDYQATYFNQTMRISTYLYAFCAGPYYEHKCKNTFKGIPQSIYVRESLKKYLLDTELNCGEMQEILDKAIEWYEKFFGVDYPFSKYDNVYIPEFNWGAMEHPGCVTFHEGLVFKEKSTELRRNRRAITITHELAHMWFGNLVTMDWWNDLWLNESFADFICYLCLTKYTIKRPLMNQWVDFNDSKQWGYMEDCHITTHPIAGPIPDTLFAESAFDGISYSKGAAVMRQLCSIMTEENFSLALKNYFQKHKWGNATLDDLIFEMDNVIKQKKIDLDMIQWKQEWICTSGLNICTLQKVEGGFTVNQTCFHEGDTTIRAHSMKIGMFDKEGKIFDVLKIRISGKSTTIKYDKIKNVKAFLPNYDDLTFIRIQFSSEDIAFFELIFEKGHNLDYADKSGLQEIVFWDGLFNQMCDGKLSPERFITIAWKIFRFRLPDEMFSSIIGYVKSTLSSYTKFSYIAQEYYIQMYTLLLEIFHDPTRLSQSSNFFIILRRQLISFAQTKDQIEQMIKFAFHEKFDEKRDFQKGDRWQVLKKARMFRPKTAFSGDDPIIFQKLEKIIKEQDPDNIETYEYFLKGALVGSKEDFKRVFEESTSVKNKSSSVLLAQTWSGLNNTYETSLYDPKIHFAHLTEAFERSTFYAIRYFRAMRIQTRDVEPLIALCTKALETATQQRQVKELKKWRDDLKERKNVYDNFDKSLESKTMETVRDFVFNTKRKHLTQVMAVLRSRYVVKKSINYEVVLGLQEGDHFYGEVKTTFELQKDSDGNTSDLFFDCELAEIHKIKLNDHEYTPSELKFLIKEKFIFLPAQLLNFGGKNTFICEYKGNYWSDGTGIHSFIDVDGKQYLYTQGESYLFNKVWPMFDQPNLKAYHTIRVVFPKKWNFISNTEKVNGSVEKISYVANERFENVNVWRMAKTALISTYLFGFVSGEYDEVVCTGKNVLTDKGLPPMRVFCRGILEKYMQEPYNANVIVEQTQRGILFYEKFFGHRYPFSKYDQIFVTQYNWGAMENIGCVTYTDAYVFKSKPPQTYDHRRSNTNLHELAHMWFGNLVTMDWWNNLWLKESFATFVSFYCQSVIDKEMSSVEPDSWCCFIYRKQRGYAADTMSTTHPIAATTVDTEAAEQQYDSITYTKGASVLKQLMFQIGEEAFQKALALYCNRYAYSNAVLMDLMDCFNEGIGKTGKIDIYQWKKEWLDQAGLNSLEVTKIQHLPQNKTKITIVQRAVLKKFPALRQHRVNIGLFQDGKMTRIPVRIPAKESYTFQCEGHPEVALLNENDEDFVRVIFNEADSKYFMNNISNIKEEINRLLIWFTLKDQVLQGITSSQDFLVSLFKAIHFRNQEFEKKIGVYSILVGLVHTMVSSYSPQKFYGENSRKMFEILQHSTNEFLKSDPYGLLEVNLDNILYYVRDPKQFQYCYDLFQANADKIVIKQWWSLCITLHKFAPENPKREELFTFCSLLDPSMEKQKRLQCDTLLIKDKEEFKKKYKYLVKKEHDIAIKQVVYAFVGLNNRHNEYNRKYILAHFLDDIIPIYEFGQFYFKYFIWYLIPPAVTLKEVKELETKVTALITKIDPKKTQLLIAVQNILDKAKLKRKIFEKL